MYLVRMPGESYRRRLGSFAVVLVFLTEGWGCVNLMIFNLRVFTFRIDTEKALFQVILGLL